MFDKIMNIFRRSKENPSAVKVLVVEDNDVDLRLIKNILSKEKYEVITAKDGQEGLIAAQEFMPDIIVLDCELPVLSGIEMCHRIKEDSLTKDIPVLFLTGVKTPANVINCFEADAENYLEKPIDPKVLISEIRSLLARKAI